MMGIHVHKTIFAAMITLEQLTCFKAVFEQNSYSAAARQLRKDRTTVREHILALEDELDSALFTIEGKKAVATTLAHHLYPRAKLMHKQAFEFVESALSAHSNQLNQLTIYYDTQIPRPLLTAIEQHFANQYPHLRLHYLHRNRSDTSDALEKGEAQIAFVIARGAAISAEHVGQLNLGSSGFQVYAHPDSALAQAERVTLDQLSSELQWVVENSLESNLGEMRVAGEQQVISNIDLLVEMLAVRGWSLLNSRDVQPYVEQGKLKQVSLSQMLQSYPSSVVMLYPLALEQNPVIQSLLTALPEIAKHCLN